MERKITIEEPVLYKEDYQMKMMKANTLEGILRVEGRGINGKSCYDYDVSGKISMKAMYERSKINSEDIRTFLMQFKAVLKVTEEYLLNIHCILLKPEYIFYEEGRFYFCYYPPARQDVWEEFHLLTEYFVKQGDYQEQECVRLMFLLHKETMEENYSLEKLMAECMQETEVNEKKEKRSEKEVREGSKNVEYDSEEHDWITEQELGSNIMRDTENMWTPVKRFLGRHKKQKWGDWDGLHIEEEDL